MSISPRAELRWILIGIVVGAIAFHFLVSSVADFEPADAGLGEGTRGHASFLDGARISARPARPQDVSDLLETFRALRENDRKRIYLWLGASQLHAVNKLAAGDELGVYYANEAARAAGADIAYVQLSTPNGSLKDLMGLYLVARSAGLVPDGLIVGLTYDDLRESEFQRDILELVPPVDRSLVDRYAGGLAHLAKAQLAYAEPEVDEAVERSPTSGTPQAALEEVLQSGLEDRWSAYELRGKLAATGELIVLGTFSRFRGDAMRRRSASIPPPAQAGNEAALDSLIRLAKDDGVSDILVYKAPHRPSDGVFYHVRERYDAYFGALQPKLEEAGVRYADFELLVPQEYWGVNRAGRPDVFHFMDYGHRKLGAAVDRVVSGEAQ